MSLTPEGKDKDRDRKRSAHWSDPDTEVLIQLLIQHKDTGRTTDNGFKPEVWKEAAKALSVALVGGPKTPEACKSRWQRLQRDFKAIKDAEGLPGFKWDRGSHRLIASQETWDTAEKKKQIDVYKCQKICLPTYDALSLLCPADIVRTRSRQRSRPSLAASSSESGSMLSLAMSSASTSSTVGHLTRHNGSEVSLADDPMTGDVMTGGGSGSGGGDLMDIQGLGMVGVNLSTSSLHDNTGHAVNQGMMGGMNVDNGMIWVGAHRKDSDASGNYDTAFSMTSSHYPNDPNKAITFNTASFSQHQSHPQHATPHSHAHPQSTVDQQISPLTHSQPQLSPLSQDRRTVRTPSGGTGKDSPSKKPKTSKHLSISTPSQLPTQVYMASGPDYAMIDPALMSNQHGTVLTYPPPPGVAGPSQPTSTSTPMTAIPHPTGGPSGHNTPHSLAPSHMPQHHTGNPNMPISPISSSNQQQQQHHHLQMMNQQMQPIHQVHHYPYAVISPQYPHGGGGGHYIPHTATPYGPPPPHTHPHIPPLQPQPAQSQYPPQTPTHGNPQSHSHSHSHSQTHDQSPSQTPHQQPSNPQSAPLLQPNSGGASAGTAPATPTGSLSHDPSITNLAAQSSQSSLSESQRRTEALVQLQERENDLPDEDMVEVMSEFEENLAAADTYLAIKKEGLRKLWLDKLLKRRKKS